MANRTRYAVMFYEAALKEIGDAVKPYLILNISNHRPLGFTQG